MTINVFRIMLLQILLAQYSGRLTAQTQVQLPVNVWQAIQDGNASIAHSPLDIGTIGQVFDGDAASLARSAAVNPMVVTSDCEINPSNRFIVCPSKLSLTQ